MSYYNIYIFGVILQCLHFWCHITCSGLKHAEIEDDGIQEILDAFAHANSNVEKIYLWGNKVHLNLPTFIMGSFNLPTLSSLSMAPR